MPLKLPKRKGNVQLLLVDHGNPSHLRELPKIIKKATAVSVECFADSPREAARAKEWYENKMLTGVEEPKSFERDERPAVQRFIHAEANIISKERRQRNKFRRVWKEHFGEMPLIESIPEAKGSHKLSVLLEPYSQKAADAYRKRNSLEGKFVSIINSEKRKPGDVQDLIDTNLNMMRKEIDSYDHRNRAMADAIEAHINENPNANIVHIVGQDHHPLLWILKERGIKVNPVMVKDQTVAPRTFISELRKKEEKAKVKGNVNSPDNPEQYAKRDILFEAMRYKIDPRGSKSDRRVMESAKSAVESLTDEEINGIFSEAEKSEHPIMKAIIMGLEGNEKSARAIEKAR